MLLSDAERQTVRGHLAAVTRPVTILFFTQTFNPPNSARVAKQVLDEVAALSDLVRVEEVSLVLDQERAAGYGVEHIPTAVLLADDADTGIRFIGAAAGYEFTSLVDAVKLAGTGQSGLSDHSKALIARWITKPTQVRVFVTPTCAHCPRAVTLAHRMAIESCFVQATCVDASEFIDLSRRFRVTGVPKTVVDDAVEFFGALPEEEFVRAALGLDSLAM